MNATQLSRPRQTVMEQFEEMLKRSDYLANALNTHRQATAEVIAEFLAIVIDNRAIRAEQVLEALHKIDHEGGKPSIGSARRLVAGLVRDAVNRRAQG